MVSKNIEKAIIKYLAQEADLDDLSLLSGWIQVTENQVLFEDYVRTNYKITISTMPLPDVSEIEKNLLLQIKKDLAKMRKLKIRKRIFKYTAAIFFIGILMLGYVFKSNLFNASKQQLPIEVVKTNAIVPGNDKAILTLEDGSHRTLEEGASFQTKNINSDGQKIVYKSANKPSNASEIKYNYLTVPRGGEFFLTLSDGTKVWLNSETQLKYPVNFIKGETREVELVYGEAYFDVSPSTENNDSKFITHNQNQDIEVLGTEFNIKAYKDETNIYTTLVEGKVSIDAGGISKQSLLPNQQSNLDTDSNSITVAVVDVESVVSWKNGVFSFKGMSLKNIMKVISRWYDIDVVFENESLKSVEFRGVLGKNQSIQQILSIMKSNTITDYKIVDKTIILK